MALDYYQVERKHLLTLGSPQRERERLTDLGSHQRQGKHLMFLLRHQRRGTVSQLWVLIKRDLNFGTRSSFPLL